MKNWSLQDAKAKFSEVVNFAISEGPQIVTRRGKAVAVVVSVDEYEKLTGEGEQESLGKFLLNSPLREVPYEYFSRDPDPPRDIEL